MLVVVSQLKNVKSLLVALFDLQLRYFETQFSIMMKSNA